MKKMSVVVLFFIGFEYIEKEIIGQKKNKYLFIHAENMKRKLFLNLKVCVIKQHVQNVEKHHGQVRSLVEILIDIEIEC